MENKKILWNHQPVHFGWHHRTWPKNSSKLGIGLAFQAFVAPFCQATHGLLGCFDLDQWGPVSMAIHHDARAPWLYQISDWFKGTSTGLRHGFFLSNIGVSSQFSLRNSCTLG
jgi:hypothetical protein